MSVSRVVLVLSAFAFVATLVEAAPPKSAQSKFQQRAESDLSRGNTMLEAYFAAETKRIADRSLAEIKTAEDWKSHREEYRRQLREMLSLDPMPEKSPLQAQVTGTLEEKDFVVEKVQFQSLPGLYVTGNLYKPKKIEGRLPAILYVCGHGQEKKDDISFGNKTHYRQHGAWYARNGYVCLAIDTVQLGEIEGIHHGTYRYDMWWWNARGYTPAGVEAWNGIRALDYLETRSEIDKDRLGVTGRSGGGAYSWWIAALDDRIKVAVPVAGITNLKNHVVDGCVEGHCDCMYPVNTYGWDYGQFAAMISPRPLMISNTDKDPIFPQDGVEDVYNKAKRIYELQGAGDNIRLTINSGGHVDSPELQVHAFQWFNRHLKGDGSPVAIKADPFFTPAELRVFDALPGDERNTRIHESFVPLGEGVKVPDSKEAWAKQRDAWLAALREKSFGGWPAELKDGEGLDIQAEYSVPCGSLNVSAYDFTSQENIRLRLFVVSSGALKRKKPERYEMQVLDDAGWRRFLSTFRLSLAIQLLNEDPVTPDPIEFARLRTELESSSKAIVYFAPRGIGMTEWTRDQKERRHIRRRFMLLGETLDGMRVWDVRRAIQALRSLPQAKNVPVELIASGDAAGIALYASLFEPKIAALQLEKLATSHRTGPDFLNVLRFLDVPQAVAMAAERSIVNLKTDDGNAWSYSTSVSDSLKFDAAGAGLRLQAN